MFFIWRICILSFISVKVLFLCNWHTTVPCSPCSWAFSAWYLSSEPTQSNNCLAQGCFQPTFRVCLQSSSVAAGWGADSGFWSWGALSSCPVQPLPVSLPPAGCPEALAVDKKKGPQQLLFEKESIVCEDTTTVEISLSAFFSETTFRRSYFGIFHSISHQSSVSFLSVYKLVGVSRNLGAL